jgi:hypothetical protein
MFDAGGVEVDAGGVMGVDVAPDGLFAEAPDDPLPLFFFPLEAAAPMMPRTITPRITVRIGCRRNQFFFFGVVGGFGVVGWAGAAGCCCGGTIGGGGWTLLGVGAGAAFIGLPQLGQAAASVETWWPQSSHLASAMS